MAMDLETPAPPPAPEPTPPAEPVAAAPPAAPPDPDEAAAVEVQGAKMVPLDALKAARAEAKSLKDKAAKVDEIAAWYQAKKPYIDVLEANPNILTRATQPEQQQPQAPPQADPELVELARSLDYYRADGQPDLERAQKHARIIQRQAERIAQQMVAPVAQNTFEQRTAANFSQFANQKLPNGQPVDQNTLAKYFRALPAQYTADPRIAAVAFNLAAMEQMQSSPLPPNPAAPTSAPLVTEPVGGAPRTTNRMSDLERLVAGQRGIDDKKYAELTKGFTAGRVSSLED